MSDYRDTYGKRVRVEAFTPGRAVKAWDERLKIDFAVSATASGKLGSCRLKLYNLAEDSIGHLRTKRLVVRVLAGFGEQLALIHTGTVTRVRVNEDGPDGITELESEDGYARWASVRVNRSWSSTTARAVAEQLARDAGYTLRMSADIADIELPDGYHAAGLWRTEFAEIIATLGARWAIVDGTLQVVRRGQPIQRRAIILSAATGLVGTPVETGARNMTVRCALQPAIKVNSYLRVDARGREQFGRALTVKHAGSTWGDDWFTDVEIRKL